MKSNVLKPNSSTSWFSHSLSSLAVCGAHRTKQNHRNGSRKRTTSRELQRLHRTSKRDQRSRQHLEDVQDLVGLLLGDNGVVVEAAELPLEPEGVDVSGMQVLFLGRHHVACDAELKKIAIQRNVFSVSEWWVRLERAPLSRISRLKMQSAVLRWRRACSPRWPPPLRCRRPSARRAPLQTGPRPLPEVIKTKNKNT